MDARFDASAADQIARLDALQRTFMHVLGAMLASTIAALGAVIATQL